LIGLTCLTTNGRPLIAPKLNRRRAGFVLSKIDEILAWEKATERERDSKFVGLGRYLCEVRAGKYWRVDNVRSFDEFLERKFPESRRKAYYLMAIHEQLPRVHKIELQQVGWRGHQLRDKWIQCQHGNGVADCLPLGSGNLDVRLERQRSPLANPLCTLKLSGRPGSGSVTSFAPNITRTALFWLDPNNANDRFQMP
jgi:hypothetical protein